MLFPLPSEGQKPSLLELRRLHVASLTPNTPQGGSRRHRGKHPRLRVEPQRYAPGTPHPQNATASSYYTFSCFPAFETLKKPVDPNSSLNKTGS